MMKNYIKNYWIRLLIDIILIILIVIIFTIGVNYFPILHHWYIRLPIIFCLSFLAAFTGDVISTAISNEKEKRRKEILEKTFIETVGGEENEKDNND